MYILIVENSYNEQLELTNNPAYVITSIDGLDPPEATINTTKNANSDGSVYNSSYLNDRQIIITMAINYPAEVNRIALYQYFKTKMPITLYYQNDSRNVYIKGYVQQMNVELFNKKQIAQIVIICPNPYFIDVDTQIQELSDIVDLFEFPFSVEMGSNLLPYPYYNNNKTQNGITWTVNSDGTVTANGTATARTDFFMAYNIVGLLGRGSYTLSGCPNGGSNNSYRMQLYDATNGVTYNDFGNGINFTIDENNENSQFRILASIFSGQTVVNLTFKPMINAGNTALVYQKYIAPGIEFSKITNDGVSILNKSDNSIGCIITLDCLGYQVNNPVIYHVESNTFFGLSYTLNKGDQVIINTQSKEKNVTIIKANGTVINGIGYIQSGSKWLQLIPGTNQFTYHYSNSGNVKGWLSATFEITNQYEGV